MVASTGPGMRGAGPLVNLEPDKLVSAGAARVVVASRLARVSMLIVIGRHRPGALRREQR